MFSTTRVTAPPLGWPASIIIVMLIVITAVLVTAGTPPLVACTLTGGAGVAGAVVVRVATAAPVTNLVRRALTAVQAYGVA